jgi:hypothetical protein
VMMNVLIRLAAERMHPFEVTFFRCLFSLFVMLPFIIRAGPGVLVNRKAGFYTLRAVVGLISMLIRFYGITSLWYFEPHKLFNNIYVWIANLAVFSNGLLRITSDSG